MEAEKLELEPVWPLQPVRSANDHAELVNILFVKILLHCYWWPLAGSWLLIFQKLSGELVHCGVILLTVCCGEHSVKDNNNNNMSWQQLCSPATKHSCYYTRYSRALVNSSAFSRQTLEKSELISNAWLFAGGRIETAINLLLTDSRWSLCSGLILNHVTLLCLLPGEEYTPSYYPLENADTKVCLATGFSRYDQHDDDSQFNETKPARIEGDSLFNQVSYSTCQEADDGSGPCEDKLRPGVCWSECDTASFLIFSLC